MNVSRVVGPHDVDTTYVIVTAMEAPVSGSIQCHGYAQIFVRDLGWKDGTSNVGFEYIGQVASAVTITGIPTAPVQNYEKYYPSSSWGTFYGTGAAVGSSSTWYNYVGQGQWSTGTQGALRGLWTYPSMTSDLSGATISRAMLYIKNEHTRWGAGGTAYIFTHGNTSVPATLGASTTNQIAQAFAKGQGIWIELPSSHFAGLKSGAIRGYGLHTTGSDNYGYWNKASQIWIKYSK